LEVWVGFKGFDEVDNQQLVVVHFAHLGALFMEAFNMVDCLAVLDETHETYA